MTSQTPIDVAYRWYQAHLKELSEYGVETVFGVGPYCTNVSATIEFNMPWGGALLQIWQSGETQFGGLTKKGEEFQEYRDHFDEQLLDELRERVLTLIQGQ